MTTASTNTDPVLDDPVQSLIDPPEGAAVAVSYLRVSTKEQAQKGGRDEGFSIPAQREANRRKAEQLGAAVVEEFIDAGESARKADRPELMRMIRYVKQHKVAYCIVHKVDRLARNRADDVTIHLALQQAGVLLVSATENIDETPSGMLLHGIMSTIAEFYSRNLATEVTKGMTQKAAVGGTLGKAPIGYLNVRTRDEMGRELRTIELDPERAPMIEWAFKAYASGNWSVSQLHDELTSRGLRSLPTPKRAAKALAVSTVHRLLTNPYYKGDVVYRGTRYKGNHPALVPAEVWYQVQSVLTAHQCAVEATQVHGHYLKGTIHCGQCGSRLIVSNAKNRHGNVYCYFVCSGRHSKRTECTRQAMLIEDVEKLVEDYYSRVQITPAQQDALAGMLHHEFDRLMAAETEELARLTANRDRLESEQDRLMQAHYADAIPLTVLKREQDRILAELDKVTRRIDAHFGDYADARAHLDDALGLLANCADIYNRCDDANRRLCNQAFFTKVYIDEDDELRVENNRPFEMLLDPEINANALTWAENADKARTTTNDSVGKGSSLVRRVELRGIEPLTFSLRTRRATNCATAPSPLAERRTEYHFDPAARERIGGIGVGDPQAADADRPLAGRQNVDHEHECRAAGDRVTGSRVAVAEVRRNDQQHLAADLLADESLDPAVNEAAGRQDERIGRAAIPRGIELVAVEDPAGVLHGHALAVLDHGAVSGNEVLGHEARGQLGAGVRHRRGAVGSKGDGGEPVNRSNCDALGPLQNVAHAGHGHHHDAAAGAITGRGVEEVGSHAGAVEHIGDGGVDLACEELNLLSGVGVVRRVLRGAIRTRHDNVLEREHLALRNLLPASVGDQTRTSRGELDGRGRLQFGRDSVAVVDPLHLREGVGGVDGSDGTWLRGGGIG